MAAVEIYQVSLGRRSVLIASVDSRGRVVPDDETTAGITQHVKGLKADGIRGKKLLERLERSYTNGYLMARTVK